MVIHVCRVRSLVKKMILLQATACIFQHLYISDSFGIVCFGASFWIYLLFVLIHPSRAFFHLMCMFWHFVCILEKKRSGSFSVFLHGCFLLHLVSFCDHFCIIILTARMATIPPPHQVLQRVCFSGYDETYFAHTQGEWAFDSPRPHNCTSRYFGQMQSDADPCDPRWSVLRSYLSHVLCT